MAMHETFALLQPVAALLALAALVGGVLGCAARAFRVEGNPLVERIDALLPQTQCGQCGYPGCKPYARAIVEGDGFNKCPPGGESTLLELANLLGVEPLPLDDAHTGEQQRKVASIRESECIGCAKCIQACPVDAILGAARHMHTVIAEECTGCDLCVEPCPVDCIDMIAARSPAQVWHWPRPEEPLGAAGLIATDRGRAGALP